MQSDIPRFGRRDCVWLMWICWIPALRNEELITLYSVERLSILPPLSRYHWHPKLSLSPFEALCPSHEGSSVTSWSTKDNQSGGPWSSVSNKGQKGSPWLGSPSVTKSINTIDDFTFVWWANQDIKISDSSNLSPITVSNCHKLSQSSWTAVSSKLLCRELSPLWP